MSFFDDMAEEPNIDEEESKQLLRDLEKNTPEEIRRQRQHFRIEIEAPILLQSGNASQHLEGSMKGVTGDLSEGGLSAMFPLPVGVGDIYRLNFDRKRVDLPMVYGKCVRCRFVRDNAYEAGFTFFSPIRVPDSLMAQAQGGLDG